MPPSQSTQPAPLPSTRRQTQLLDEAVGSCTRTTRGSEHGDRGNAARTDRATRQAGCWSRTEKLPRVMLQTEPPPVVLLPGAPAAWICEPSDRAVPGQSAAVAGRDAERPHAEGRRRCRRSGVGDGVIDRGRGRRPASRSEPGSRSGPGSRSEPESGSASGSASASGRCSSPGHSRRRCSGCRRRTARPSSRGSRRRSGSACR